MISSLVASKRLRGTTLANRTARMRWFASFVEAHGVRDLDAVDRQLVVAFLNTRRASGQTATASERRSRLAAVRCLYKEARALGLASSDPTQDIKPPPRQPISARALTNDELKRGRSHAVQRSDTRPAVCWALAEASATTSEMPNIRVSDLDLDADTVFLHGGATTDPRVARLTDWGQVQIVRRLSMITDSEGPDPVLMGEGRWDDPDEGRSAATMALVAVIRGAGLSAPGVNPRSIRAWAGARALAEVESIEVVARMLGLRSLDRTADFIDYKWKDRRP